ncbi:LPD5 domain-containing protein [Delftia tsuruhatensis]
MADVNWNDYTPVGGGSAPAAEPVDWAQFEVVKPASTGRKLADIATAFAGGAVGATKAIADAGGAGNAVSQQLGSAQDTVQSWLSPQRQAEKAARAQTIREAEQSGSVLREVGAQLGGIAEAPVSTVAEAAGSVVPIVASMFTPVGRSAAARTALGAGLGAAQGAGSVKGSIYDAVEQQQREQGATPEAARQAADRAQAYTGPNADNVALGAGLGLVTGTTGVERLVSGALAGRATNQALLRRAATGAVTEGLPEAVQGGQERLASNVAQQREGADVPTWQGVAGQAVAEGVAGGLLGAGTGAAVRGGHGAGGQSQVEPGGRPQTDAAGGAGAAPTTASPAQAGAQPGSTPVPYAGQPLYADGLGNVGQTPEALRSASQPTMENLGLDSEIPETQEQYSAGVAARNAAMADPSGPLSKAAALAGNLGLVPFEQAPAIPSATDTLSGALSRFEPERQRSARLLLADLARGDLPTGVRAFREREANELAANAPEGTEEAARVEDAGLPFEDPGPAYADASLRLVPIEREAGNAVNLAEQDLSAEPAAGPSLIADTVQRLALSEDLEPGSPLRLNDAHRLRRQVEAQGIPATVVPHPSGRGYDVQPTVRLPMEQRSAVPQERPALLGFDNRPTGRMVAGADGVRTETRAEAVSLVNQQRQQRQALEAERARRADLGLSNLTRITPLDDQEDGAALGTQPVPTRSAEVIDAPAREVGVGPASTIAMPDGRPFATGEQAQAELQRRGLTGTHEAVPAQGDPSLGFVGQPRSAEERPANWRTNAMQAGRVARSLGLKPRGKRLAEIVADIDAADTARQLQPAGADAAETGALSGSALKREKPAASSAVAPEPGKADVNSDTASSAVRLDALRDELGEGVGTYAQKLAARLSDARYSLMQEESLSPMQQRLSGRNLADMRAEIARLESAAESANELDYVAMRDDLNRSMLAGARQELDASPLSKEDRQAAASAARDAGNAADAAAAVFAAVDAGDATGRARAPSAGDQGAPTQIRENPTFAPNRGNPGSPAARAAQQQGRIEDFGETLTGARKMLYAEAYADGMAKAKALDVKAHPLSKTWPEPDYQKLLEGGTQPQAVALVRAMRDAVPTKPQSSWKLRGWSERVATLRDFADELLAGRLDPQAVRTQLNNTTLPTGIANQAALYEALGHGRSLKGIELHAGSYSMYDGVRYDPPRSIWTVSRQAKASAFGSWPRELAKGDTREAAIEAFKRRAAQLAAEQDAPARGATFEIYAKRAGGARAFFIGKKIGRNVAELKPGFQDIKTARQYLADNQAELERLLTDYKAVPPVRSASNAPRIGEDYRKGADVSPQQFQDAFGFRGVQFGNYVEGPRRQQDLNQAYDALMDMAGVLNLPPRALSLGGRLGLAFGARGSGGVDAAAAHYEPGQVVINLTKRQAAGALGHEWWHALDNYFSRQRGDGAGFMTEGERGGDGVREEMRAAFRDLRNTINATGMQERSRKLDDRRSKDYWTTGREMSARAFESYLIAKLQDQSAGNDFLANVVPASAFALEGAYPYPTAGELPQVREAFDRFFQTVDTRRGEDGSVMLFSATSDVPPGSGLTLEQAQKAVDDALSGLRTPPPVRVVLRSDELGVDAPDGVMGAAIPGEGRIVIVASAHRSADAVVETLFHEMFHLGVRNVLPEADYVQAMLDLAKRDARVRQYAIDWKEQAPDAPLQLQVLRDMGLRGSDLTARYEALAIEEGLAVVAQELRAQQQAGTRMGLRIRALANWLAGVAERMGMQRLAGRIRNMTYNEAERFVLRAIDSAGEDAPRRRLVGQQAWRATAPWATTRRASAWAPRCRP